MNKKEEKALREKLQEHNEWMKKHLDIIDKIAYVAPFHIDIDDDHVKWTLTMPSGETIVRKVFEEALDAAVDSINSAIDEDVVAAAKREDA